MATNKLNLDGDKTSLIILSSPLRQYVEYIQVRTASISPPMSVHNLGIFVLSFNYGQSCRKGLFYCLLSQKQLVH